MSVPLIVAMYGRSLILASVGQRLESDHHMRLVTLDDAGEADSGGPAPDVLLVDLGVTPVPAALALLDARPNTLLVGIDGGGARLLVLSGPGARAMTTEGLVRLIEGHATPTPA